jgi:integrase
MPADFVLHSLRHTYGTRLGETGAGAFTIMKLMGRSTVTVSQRYLYNLGTTTGPASRSIEQVT